MRFSEFKPLNEAEGPLEVPEPGPHRSDMVVALQKALAAFNYDVHATGILDPRTNQAIANAQRDLGMPATGQADKNFIKAVNSSIISTPGLSNYISNIYNDLKSAASSVVPAVSNAVSNAVSTITSPFSKPETHNKPLKSKSALAHDPEFLAKVDEVANKLGIQSQTLLRIMQHESKLNPQALSPSGNAAGLIQFMAPAASSLGTTVQKIHNMDAIQQMDLVYRYYKMIGVKPGMDVGDVYMLTFLPKYKNAPNNTVLGRKNDPTVIQRHPYITKHSVWDENPVFSNNKRKDYFTKADVIDRINTYT